MSTLQTFVTHIISHRWHDILLSIAMVTIAVITVLFPLTKAGYIDPKLLAPVFEVRSVHAHLWNARVGRLHDTGYGHANFHCDAGYYLVDTWHKIGGTNQAIWYNCIAGDW